FEKRPAVTRIGLEMTSLPPLVPCVDEDQPLALARRTYLLAQGGAPASVVGGLRVDEYVRPVRPARRIVPSGHDAAKQPIRRLRTGEHILPINEQQRPVAHANIAAIVEQRQDVSDEPRGVVFALVLAGQDLVVASVPAPRPVLVGPADADRKVRCATR